MNEELLAEYIGSLQKRIDRIASLQVKLAEGNAKAEENVRLLAHSLHGSGTSFGFPEISEAGKALEQADAGMLAEPLEDLANVLRDVVAANAGLLKKQAETNARGDGAAAEGSRKDSSRESEETQLLKILVVDDDPDMS